MSKTVAKSNSVPAVYVYGGCVSRDTAEYLKLTGVGLTGYTARQSLISAFSAKGLGWNEIQPESLTSRFQRRAVSSDLQGGLVLDLLEKLSNADLVLCDLAVERNGVWLFPSGAVITNSMEFNNSGLITEIGKHAELVKFGNDRHFNMWKEALLCFADLLKYVDRKRDVVFLRHTWAQESEEGHTFPFGESRLDPQRMNSLYGRYQEQLTIQGFVTVDVPRELCITTRSHKWGIAPYHYVPEFYTFVAKQLTKLIEQRND